MKKLLSSLVVLTSLAFFLPSTLFVGDAAGAPPLDFPDGVASGDVTSQSAVLWTRVDRATLLKVEVSTNSRFRGKKAFKQEVLPSSDDDLTAKVLAAPLAANTVYFYRWSDANKKGRRGGVSQTGTFKTAPNENAPLDVTFAYTGDSDGLFQQFGNNFEVLDAVRAENPDFWVYLGDTIYSDSSLKPAPSLTLNDYRDDYRLNRSIDALPDLLASTSAYSVWDDHEVQNDYSGQTVDPTRYANGRRAFLEYMPTLETSLPEDLSCAGDPRFQVFSWGKDVDIFILDERSCRSANVADGNACKTKVCLGGSNAFGPCTVDAECPDGGTCSIPTGADDLVPTLPPPVRAGFIAQGFPITLNPPPGCLAAIFDPSRTMLGPVQKAAFKNALQSSTAKFKFIVNELPIQQFWALPYDRWEGYGVERNEILNFIRQNVSGNVVFLTTDMHANVINTVVIDTFLDPGPIAPEFITGPIATNTFEAEVLAFAAGAGIPGPALVAAFQQILSIAGATCRNLDTNSYALVEVDDTGTASISLRDENGAVVTDQLIPTNECRSTIGGP